MLTCLQTVLHHKQGCMTHHQPSSHPQHQQLHLVPTANSRKDLCRSTCKVKCVFEGSIIVENTPVSLKGTRQYGFCIFIKEAKQITIQHTRPQWCACATKHVLDKLRHEALCKLKVSIWDTICRPPNLTNNDRQCWESRIGERCHQAIVAGIENIGVNMWAIDDWVCWSIEKCKSQREICGQNQAEKRIEIHHKWCTGACQKLWNLYHERRNVRTKRCLWWKIWWWTTQNISIARNGCLDVTCMPCLCKCLLHILQRRKCNILKHSIVTIQERLIPNRNPPAPKPASQPATQIKLMDDSETKLKKFFDDRWHNPHVYVCTNSSHNSSNLESVIIKDFDTHSELTKP